MILVGVLAAAWCLALILTSSLDRIDGVFTPAWQVRLLGTGAITVSAATVTSMLAAGCVLGTRWGLPVIALATMMGIAVVVAGWRPVRHGIRVQRRRRAARVFLDGRRLAPDVVLIEDATPEAFAVPGRPGVVVVTTALRNALSPNEFSVLLRHERAHLRYRHHVYIQLVEFAAHLNPLFSRWSASVRFAAERHADEHAARIGRPVATRALAKAALLSAASRRGAARRLGIGGDAAAVVARVRALRGPQPARQKILPIVAAVMLLVAIGVDLEVTADLIQDRIALEPGETVLLG